MGFQILMLHISLLILGYFTLVKLDEIIEKLDKINRKKK